MKLKRETEWEKQSAEGEVFELGGRRSRRVVRVLVRWYRSIHPVLSPSRFAKETHEKKD